jgi:lipopolysaccharide biosynthesis protein
MRRFHKRQPENTRMLNNLADSHVRESVRLIAFYLPQYHPIRENDLWWGKGFTEWMNVARARPLYRGHYQPHLPADLGFYDLRLADTREAQAQLAGQYGIHGFCYYHYWFHGRRLLERPFNEVLESGRPSFPFCLCWANEKWTREWDGVSDHVLMEQQYSLEDDRQHIQWLARAFRDERCIRVDGKALFLVYRASALPKPLETTALWREEARKLGAGELMLAKVESFPEEHTDPRGQGFDLAIEFQPDWTELGRRYRRSIAWRIAGRLGLASRAYQRNFVYHYAAVVRNALAKGTAAYPRCPCVTPSWDNTPRAIGRPATIFEGSTPELYEKWLVGAIKKVRASSCPKLVFVNAWNEWAEGNHLEPDLQFGRQYLEATQRALRSHSRILV